MKEYLEQVMHQSIEEEKYNHPERLPLVCRNAFELSILKLGQLEFLLAAPLEEMSLTEIRKMRLRLERYTGYTCAFYLKKVNWYAAPRMVEEGIPFVWERHQVYLPFIGMLLQKNAQRTLKNCTVISFLTQKLLLKALYENWKDVSAVQAAKELEVSRMSAVRCFDEIEALGMPFLKRETKSRRFYAMDDKREMWETMQPFLRNPVIHSFRLAAKPEADLILSGISALSEYSMLGEDSCPTYAIRKNQIMPLGIRDIPEIPAYEDPACIVQVVGYLLPFGNGKSVDPLSLTLMLTAENLEDPRVAISLKEMLEAYV